MSDEVVDLLREMLDGQRLLLAEVQGLRGDLAGRGRGALAPADLVKLRRLLPEIARAVADASFTVQSLGDHGKLTGDGRLNDALTTCGSGRSLGRLLRRAAGHEIGDLRLRLIGDRGPGLIWSCDVLEKGVETTKTKAGA